jgi:NAD(P)-dependent dehydrogenase (short-subunit alcohol dehydrogenase family)
LPRSGPDNQSQEMNEFRRSSSYQRVWFITGASDGIGRALTEAVLARGERAVVTAHKPERVRDLIERYPAQALVVELDVTRHEQVQRSVTEASDRFGRIDVLVNTTSRLFEANVFGLVDITRAVLPLMERVCGGHIINVLSAVPGRPAVEGFSAALARQMAPLGIRVSTFEGGVNGEHPQESAGVVEAIIVAVDAETGEPDVRRSEFNS